MIQAGTAGENLDALLSQPLQVVEHRRALDGQLGAAVIEQHGRGQLLLLHHGKNEGLHELVAQLVVAAAHAVGVDGNDELALAGAGVAKSGTVLLGVRNCHGTGGRDNHVPLGVRDLLDRGRATLLLRHLGDVLDGRLVVDRGHDSALAIELLEGLERLDDGQRAGIAHGIDFNLGRHSYILSKGTAQNSRQSHKRFSLMHNANSRTARLRLAHAPDDGGDTSLGM